VSLVRRCVSSSSRRSLNWRTTCGRTCCRALLAMLVVVGAAATWRQVHVSREGQITERFTRAVEQVGSENVDVRIGGIYALERIAMNSAADRNAVQFMLGAFVRNHAPWPVGGLNDPEHPTAAVDESLPWLQVRAPDIQAAVGVLGRRPQAPEGKRLYLSRVDLRGLQLDDARLTCTQFRYANLARAWLRGTRLDRSDLKSSDLRWANLEDARLVDVNLSNACLDGAKLRGADLSGADLSGASLRDAGLAGAVFAGAKADRDTVWPPGFSAGRRRELGIVDKDPGELAGMETRQA
jgi:hypothetical protein